MPTRRTKRGEARVPLRGERDVVICGASFAGLAVARELAGSGARVLLLDRYEIGERQTSACAAPTEWLHAMGDAEFETATVTGRGAAANGAIGVATDRGDVSALLVVDALGWRRLLDDVYQPPDAPLSRGLEVHPSGNGRDLEIWIERPVIPAGYGWSFPADDELRVGVGSFIPHDHVKRPTVELVERLELPAVRYQGNWIPHRLREATADGAFFAGDSAGHCLPLTAEGIRTAFYFGIACGRELRRVLEGRADRSTAPRRYAAV